MGIVKIPKKTRGEFREIYVPSKKEKARFRALLPELNQIALDNCGGCVHGFMPGKSPVTNAKAHIGYQYSLSFDLKDFFDSVKPGMVQDYINNPYYIDPSDQTIKNKTDLYFIQGRAYQGLPTSPQIANLAAIKMDNWILGFCESQLIPRFKEPIGDEPNISDSKIHTEEIKYTRYADDLTFSFNNYETRERILKELPTIVNYFGFTINSEKTHFQSAKFGNRIITGISVGQTCIEIPRQIKRLIKILEHQGKLKILKQFPTVNKEFVKARLNKYPGSLLHGYREWAKLKLPHYPRSHTLLVIDAIINYIKLTNAVTNTTKYSWPKYITELRKIEDRYGQKTYIAKALDYLQNKAGINKGLIKIINDGITNNKLSGNP